MGDGLGETFESFDLRRRRLFQKEQANIGLERLRRSRPTRLPRHSIKGQNQGREKCSQKAGSSGGLSGRRNFAANEPQRTHRTQRCMDRWNRGFQEREVVGLLISTGASSATSSIHASSMAPCASSSSLAYRSQASSGTMLD